MNIVELNKSCYGCIYLEDNTVRAYCSDNGESVNPNTDRCENFDNGTNESE